MHHTDPTAPTPSPPPPRPAASSTPTPSALTPPTPTTTTTTLSDIFSTSPSPPRSRTPTTHSFKPDPFPDSNLNPNTTLTEPSDIPRLRSTHATAGYRDGIAASKESTVQAGFDEGYALGATVAMRAGWVVGVLEGLVREGGEVRDGGGEIKDKGSGNGEAKARDGGEGEAESRKRVEKRLAEARAELSVSELFGARYWGGDGVWRFTVVGQGGEGDVTFREVAEQHPLVRKWVGVVAEEAEKCGVDLSGFEGEEWERGRMGG